MGDIQVLKRSYRRKQKEIRARLTQFRRFLHEPVCWTYPENEMILAPSNRAHHERLFEELCFCILAANTSAQMGMKTVDSIRSLLHTAEPKEMTAHLKGIYRFINLRPQYITHCREYLGIIEGDSGNLHEILQSIDDPHHLREFLANNTGIKGIGYKEASHFLRNMGFFGYAILDKHIINTMHECGVLENNKTPSSGKAYLEMEKKYLQFAHDLKIDSDELDLLLWSEKTGKILK